MSWNSSLPSETPSQPPLFTFQPSPPPAKTKVLLPALLFLGTIVTTLTAGYILHLNFVGQGAVWARLTGVFSHPLDLLHGLPFAFTIMVILLAHELGHYLTCRYYGIDATLPYLIPAPPPFPFGTFGAVIKIRSQFPNKRQLFDVGVAGPVGGFIFIIPALIVGLQLSKPFVSTVSAPGTYELGEPLIFALAAKLFFPGEAGTTISLHPIGFAAWFGMLATSINLLPIGQLDGGHMVYGLFGARAHRIISQVSFAALIGVSLYSWPNLGYLVFTLVLLFIGFRHPRPISEFGRVGRKRLLAALIGLIIFILTFMPIPVRVIQHVGRL